MLIKFKIENFLSIKDSIELDLNASAIKELEEDNVIYSNNIKVLKCAAIYGANSSGKTNILKALIFMKKFILNSSKDQSKDIDVQSFKLNTRTEERPSKFEIQFLINGIKYRYGFEVDYNKIHSEWLFYTKVNKEYNLFLRDEKSITVDERFEEGKNLEDKTRSNALFLSVTSQFNGKTSMSIIKWISEFKYILDNNRQFHQNYSTKLFENPEYRNIIKNYLLRADLGFSDVEAEKITIPDIEGFSESLKNLFLADFKNESIIMTSHPQYDENGKPVNNVYFNMFQNESLGTQKYFGMSGLIIEALMHGRPLIIDEFDSRLHPVLCTSIIKLFNSKINNPKNAQLIFVSHNTNFLNKNIFRRDQILLAKKDSFGSTSLISLAQAKVRVDEAYEKNYLQGEYDGIPKLNDQFNLFN